MAQLSASNDAGTVRAVAFAYTCAAQYFLIDVAFGGRMET